MIRKRFRPSPWACTVAAALLLVGLAELAPVLTDGRIPRWFRQRTEQRLTRTLVPEGTLAERVAQIEQVTGVGIQVDWDAPTTYTKITRDFRPIRHLIEPTVTAWSELEDVARLVANRSQSLQVDDWGHVRISPRWAVHYTEDIRHIVGDGSGKRSAHSMIVQERILNLSSSRTDGIDGAASSAFKLEIKDGILTADQPPQTIRELKKVLADKKNFIDAGTLYTLWPEK